MPHADRRIILLPAGLPADKTAALRSAVAAAAEIQQRLADKSQHVLHLTGRVELVDDTIVIGHEPASPLQECEPSPRFFDPTKPGADPERLMSAAGALFNAMRAAHTGESGRPTVHGGISPGVLLIDENDVIKIADFGVAQAIAAVLGEEAYLNAAVGPRGELPGVSGAWEMLEPHVESRDDRICAFIDPAKHADPALLKTFESASDVIAAAFVLFMMAEHSHPYLSDFPDAHRNAGMAAQMAFLPPGTFRSKAIRESSDEGLKLWRELLRTMLSSEPRERPSAADLARQFDPHVPKVDFDRIKLRRWLGEIDAGVDAEQWETVERLLGQRPSVAEWPADVTARLKPIEARLAARRDEQRRQQQIAADRAAAEEWLSKLSAAISKQQWDAAQSLSQHKPKLEHFPEQTLKAAEPLIAKLREAQAEAERRRKTEAEAATARKWFAAIEQAVSAGDWTRGAELLAKRPAIEHWPAEITEALAPYEQSIEDGLAEAERAKLAAEADHRAAREWLERARAAADAGAGEQALDVLEKRPTLKHWPARLIEEADELAERVRLELGEKALSEIKRRELAVKKLGAEFVHRVTADALGKFIDPAMVHSSVSAVEFTPDDPAGEGRAQLTVSLATAADAARGAGMRSGFHFRIDAAPQGVCDDDGALRDWLVRGLTERLGELQKSKAADWLAGLHATMFPKAEAKFALSGLSPSLKTTTQLLGPGQTAGDVETELRWQAKTLTWELADAAGFAQRAVNLATAVARKLATTRLVDQSEGLKPYKGVIGVDVAPAQPPEPGVIPRALVLEGRLTLKAGAGEPRPLQTVQIKCAKVGQLSLDGDLKPAEAALRELVVLAQSASRQSLYDDLERRFKAAGARVKTTALPKKITDPLDKVTFDLKPRSGDAVTLTAAWNIGALSFEATPAWDGALAPLLSGAAASATNGAAGGSAGGSARRGLLIGGVAGVLVVACVGAYMFLGGGDSNGKSAVKIGALEAAVAASAVLAELDYEVTAAEGGAAEPFAIEFYWDRNGDGAVDGGDERVARVDGETGDGQHVAKASIPLAAQRPADETRSLLARIDTSGWKDGPKEDALAEVAVNIPRTAEETPTAADVAISKFEIEPLAQDAKRIKATIEYTVVGEAPEFRILLFWDQDGSGAYTEAGDQLLAALSGETSAGKHSASLDEAIADDRAVEKAETLVALLDTAAWSSAETNTRNNSVSRSVGPRGRRETPKSDLVAKGLTAQPSADSIAAVFTYEVAPGEGDAVPPFNVRFFWDLNANGAFDSGDVDLGEVAGAPAKGPQTLTHTLPLAGDRGWERAEWLVATLVTGSWEAPESNAANNHASASIGPRKPSDIVKELKDALPIFDAAKTATPELSELLKIAAPGSADGANGKLLLAAADAARVEELQPSGENVSLVLRITLKGDAGGISQRLLMQRADGGWSGVATNSAGVDALAKAATDAYLPKIQQTAEDVKKMSRKGKLADARGAASKMLTSLESVWPHLPGGGATQALQDAFTSLPPGIDNPAVIALLKDYEWKNEEIDAASGYPSRITERGGGRRVLLLVATAPEDPVWTEISSGGERSWQIFYVDAAEWADGGAVQAFESVDEAQTAAGRAQRFVPTRDEWMLAALKLRGAAQNMLGGYWEWCRDADSSAWACGGCTLEEVFADVIKPPDASAAPAAVIEWLRQPLVTQPRVHGDGLVGLRSVLRIWPTP